MNVLKIVKDGRERDMNIDHLLLKNLQLLSVPTDEVLNSALDINDVSLVLERCIKGEQTVYLNGNKIIWVEFLWEPNELYVDRTPDDSFESSLQHYLVRTLYYRFLPSKYAPHLVADTTNSSLERSIRCQLVYALMARLFDLVNDEQYETLRQNIFAYPQCESFPITKRQELLDASREEIARSTILDDLDFRGVLKGKYCSTIKIERVANPQP